jgi:hypothetical protein
MTANIEIAANDARLRTEMKHKVNALFWTLG